MISSTPPINKKMPPNLRSPCLNLEENDVLFSLMWLWTDRLTLGIAHLQKQKNYRHYPTQLLSFCLRQLSCSWLSYKYCPGMASPRILHGSCCPRKKSFVLLKKLFMFQILAHLLPFTDGYKFCQNLQNSSKQVNFSWPIPITIAISTLHECLEVLVQF